MKVNASILLFLTLFALSQPALAYSWENDIDIGHDSMSWVYTESYSDNHSLLFKVLIDSELGNNDNFVSAWELLKVDVKSRKTFFESISNEMDVRINNSSDGISIKSMESSFSSELLGPVTSPAHVVNIYEVHYSFSSILPSAGNIWFRGEPGSNVTIKVPENIEIRGSHGIDDVTTINTSNSSISGIFDKEGKASIEFAEKESYSAEYGMPESIAAPEENTYERESTSLLDDIFPGFTGGLAKELESGLNV